MSEVGDAAQFMKVGIDGVDVTLKVTGATLMTAKDFAVFLWNVAHREKLKGKTNMKKLLLKGGDLQIFQFPDENKKEIYKALKGYGVLFSELPDLNRADGLSEIVFHSEATNRVNQVIERISRGQLIDMEQYLSNGDSKEIDKETEYFEKNFDPSIEPDKLSPEEKEELTSRLKIIGAKSNPTEENITITRKLVEERKDNYFTRIPYERDKYIVLNKEDCLWIDKGKTLMARIKKDSEYEIFGKNGKIKENVTGSKLYKDHYDEVSVKTKKRAMEQTRKQSVINAKKKQSSNRKKGSR